MSPGDSTVIFKDLGVGNELAASEKRSLKDFAKALSRAIVDGRPFTSLITDDLELRRLNKQFLGHDYATDVLSFPSAGISQELGEIAISMERAAAQAEEHGHSRLDEVRVLMLHGLLHLAGMDHERDHGAMRRAEDKWRAYFDLPRTLISRASSGKAVNA